MNKLIVYASKRGTTEDCAYRIRDVVSADMINVKSVKKGSLDEYPIIIIGTPMYVGRPPKAVRIFCKKHLKKLLTKKIYIFVCGLDISTPVQDMLGKSLPTELLKHATLITHLGGELKFDRMNFFERGIINSVRKELPEEPKVNEEKLREFWNIVNDII